MRILDRYLIREFLTPLTFCLGGILVVWCAFDFCSQMTAMQRLGLGEIVEYYALRTPGFLVLLIPIALLVSLLYALTNHARHFELTAMRAAGISLWRLCLPYFLIALVAGAGLFVLGEFCVPQAEEKARDITESHDDHFKNPTDRAQVTGFPFTTREGRMWCIGVYNPETSEMLNLWVSWPLADGSWVRWKADSAVRSNGVWTFYNASEYLMPTGTDDFTKRLIVKTNAIPLPSLSETPEDIRNELKIAPRLTRTKLGSQPEFSITEILDYQRRHPHPEAGVRALLNTELQERLAAPWTCVVVVLLAISFGAASGRRNAFVGVAGAITICFGFWVLQKISLALGMNGSLPAWVAAWIPNLIFGVYGAWRTARLR
jgi:LPS export ABC transporter permease LptG